MKVEQQTNEITPAHNGVVFLNKEASDKKDLQNTIGRFDETRKAIAFLKGTPNGDKWKALMDGGFQIHLAKDDRNNYYVTDLLDTISKTGIHETEGETADVTKTDDLTDGDRPELVFKEEKDFLEQDVDSAMDIDFTTENLNYEHRVGLYNEDANTYTLREDVKDLLDEFEFNIDENEDGVVARIAPESVKARSLLKLVNLLKNQEQDDADDLQEALDSNKVQFDEMDSVKQLLRRLSLCQKHGDIEESDEAEVELNELIKQYKESNPPAAGIDKVEAQRDSILSKQESTDANGNKLTHKTQKQTQAPSKPTQSKPKKSNSGDAKKVVKAVSKVVKRESLKAPDAARLAESILSESGIQVRGQQDVY
ncbi:hypothetical protein BCU26_016705 [Vibrio splendidus]|uniref:hypothetical protein n=1 Tax=Vibrio splendidus TaxID=29497 RepID=UPI000C81B705|nr:hypothetical protein [Vibrio splendidus]PMH68767.1 hypothetical protein BCU61_16900 [Vibrio splendidus]PMJ31765.1 hypothetical protein BCU26_02220 [Vibrio splendidus]